MNLSRVMLFARRLISRLKDLGDKDGIEDAIALIAALQSGPLASGVTVDSSQYSRRVDKTFGQTATVRVCWFDDLSGKWWCVAEDGNGQFAIGACDWFTRIDTEITPINSNATMSLDQ